MNRCFRNLDKYILSVDLLASRGKGTSTKAMAVLELHFIDKFVPSVSQTTFGSRGFAAEPGRYHLIKLASQYRAESIAKLRGGSKPRSLYILRSSIRTQGCRALFDMRASSGIFVGAHDRSEILEIVRWFRGGGGHFKAWVRRFTFCSE
jgi:hypothetical protein